MANYFHVKDDDRVRYLLISIVTGVFDFAIAFSLLRLHVPPPASLACSIVIAGVANYLALEWWGFARREGAFSTVRLAGSGLAELGTYLVRLAVLYEWRAAIPGESYVEHIVGLAVAYCVGFMFGYVFRNWVVFRRW